MGQDNVNKQTKPEARDFIPESPAAKAKKAGDQIHVGDGFVKPKRTSLVVFIALAVFGLLFAGIFYLNTPAQKVARQERAEQAANTEMDLANDAILAKDTEKAIKHAKKAVAASPKNLEAINLAGSLLEKEDPEEAKRLYEQGLAVYKEQNDFDGGKANVVQYYAAAGLAEDAGKTAEAIEYYQAVLDKANDADSYERSLELQSSRSIERLR